MLRDSDYGILKSILQTEGGFVDNPVDKGGPTNHGITAKTLGEWRHLGRPATVEEVKGLQPAEALEILGQRYVVAPGFDAIRFDKVRGLIIDMWVNHGPTRATLIIQKALKFPGDGIMGPKTLGALTAIDAASGGFEAILAERIRFYGRMIEKDHTQAEFAAGWLDRAADFLSPN